MLRNVIPLLVVLSMAACGGGQQRPDAGPAGGEGGGAGGGAENDAGQQTPAPKLSATNPLEPALVVAGTGAFELTVRGEGFVASSVVRIDSAERTTTFVDAATLKAALPAADIALPGSRSVTVHTAAIAGGGTSSSATLSVVPPKPALASSNALSPATIVAGSGDFTLTVTGTGFQPSSVVRWNGTDRATTHVSATELRATITSTDVATAGTSQVGVFTPSPGGGISETATFTIENPLPALATSLTFTPASVRAGDAAFNLTVRGTNFVATSVVRWNGAARTTSFVSATELNAAITAADVAAAGVAQITVFTPAPGGGETGAQPLQVRERPGAFAVASLANDGGLGNDISMAPALSATGRFVAFSSDSTNLVSDDAWISNDVFVRDTCRGASSCTPSTVRISVAPDGGDAFGGNNYPSMTPDGRYVAFISDAPNLVSADTAGQTDVFVRQTCIGVASCAPFTVRASVSTAGVEGNDTSDTPAISSDGRFVAFRSTATNLVAADTNGTTRDVFLRDTCIGAPGCTPSTTLLSVSSSGAAANLPSASERPAISATGRYVAFSSMASTLIATDGNAVSDVFVRDTCFGATGACSPSTTRVSIGNQGQAPNSASTAPDISLDGRFIVFESRASNLVTGDTNATGDIFLRDTCSGVAAGCTPSTVRISLTSSGAETNGSSFDPVMSPDARFIGWSTNAQNLVSTTMGGVVRDTCRGAPSCTPTTTVVTVAAPGGTTPSAFWGVLALSGNGSVVAWTADGPVVSADTNNRRDIYLSHTGF